ncbi:MAG: dynamin family protein [Pseudomonadota bacterium]
MTSDIPARALTLADHTAAMATSLAADRDALVAQLERLSTLVVPEAAERINRLIAELDGFAARVAVVGQMKAGKTALTNALIGHPWMLPSDVNPWTSVVTSVHVNTPKPTGKDAVFTFFTTEQWEGLTEVGGDYGRLIERAEMDAETEALRQQIGRMKERTEARLGRNFEMLLNKQHAFLGFSPDLISKYVCLGDDGEDVKGRYADVTRSADLYLDNPAFVLPTIICDTPGVNDPFLMREAVTIEKVGDTDICVVVLNAHQALSTVDIGLMRILMAMQHDQVILFVNRVDELQDPDRQIAEIDRYIRDLLVEMNLPADLPIVFGSAAWGEASCFGAGADIDPEAARTLQALAEARADRPADPAPLGTRGWALGKDQDLSGLEELRILIQERSAAKIGQPTLRRVRDRAVDLARQSILLMSEMLGAQSAVRTDLDAAAVIDDLDSLLGELDRACTQAISEAARHMLTLMSGAFTDFIDRETGRLDIALKYGRQDDWSPDTDRLRRDLNAAYDEFVWLAPKELGPIMQDAAERIGLVYGDILEGGAQLYEITPPEPVAPKIPASLMRTMSVDLSSGWLGRWFSRRLNRARQLHKFQEIAKAEMRDTVRGIEDIYVADFARRTRSHLHAFLSDHVETLVKLALPDARGQATTLPHNAIEDEIRARITKLEESATAIAARLSDPTAAAIAAE